MSVLVQRVGPGGFAQHRDAVARLRIAVFREWPYLYEGDLDYEARYLETYARSPRMVAVLALDGDALVGASTGLPLTDEEPAFAAPVAGAGIDPARVFYFGESVLDPRYRGLGLGHRFFDEREAHARALGFEVTAFAAVERAAGDPRRPAGARDLGPFWRKRGYVHHPELRFRIPWREIGAAEETDQTLSF